jgi:hypothetical protein
VWDVHEAVMNRGAVPGPPAVARLRAGPLVGGREQEACRRAAPRRTRYPTRGHGGAAEGRCREPGPLRRPGSLWVRGLHCHISCGPGCEIHPSQCGFDGQPLAVPKAMFGTGRMPTP